ncbi:hypothetical protein CDL15_Pgr004962 [Punica granatum]|uniref:Uncharacterized protein n=1 Tax=Punica granatum TaxID=22663 RepID=A0A218WWP6_PUNGR|nr:hypothetical protein CDL15_Pgr004962 [Punica granatum]PKI77245.1 hypothetical protein CRG98_002366 [Punica granatum]
MPMLMPTPTPTPMPTSTPMPKSMPMPMSMSMTVSSTKSMSVMPVAVMMSPRMSMGTVHELPLKNIPSSVPEVMTVPAVAPQAKMLAEPYTMTPAVHMTHTSTTPYMSFAMGKVLVMLMVMVVSLMRHPHRLSPDLRDVYTAMFSERKRKDGTRTIDY